MTDAFFTDKNQPPTEESILAALGPAAPAWRGLFDRIHSEHHDLEETWNYYADGKSWLLKATRKSKTVFWLSVRRGAFIVAFYFPARLAGALLDSELSDELKASIRSQTPIGKLLGVRVEFGATRGTKDVMTLITLKRTLK
jgi:hypothetical protein